MDDNGSGSGSNGVLDRNVSVAHSEVAEASSFTSRSVVADVRVNNIIYHIICNVYNSFSIAN